jgi:hypothetical protein
LREYGIYWPVLALADRNCGGGAIDHWVRATFAWACSKSYARWSTRFHAVFGLFHAAGRSDQRRFSCLFASTCLIKPAFGPAAIEAIPRLSRRPVTSSRLSRSEEEGREIIASRFIVARGGVVDAGALRDPAVGPRRNKSSRALGSPSAACHRRKDQPVGVAAPSCVLGCTHPLTSSGCESAL